MNTKLTMVIPGIALLSACVGVENATVNIDGTQLTAGGGSSGSSSSSSGSSSSSNSSAVYNPATSNVGAAGSTYTVLTSSGYNGIAKATTPGYTDALIAGENIYTKTAAANAGSNLHQAGGRSVSYYNNGGDAYSNYRRSNIYVNGQLFGIDLVTSKTRPNEAELKIFETYDRTGNVAVTSGEAYTGRPYGQYSYNYRGTQVSTDDNGNNWSEGYFLLNANFNNGTFSYSGSSGGDSVTARGNLNTATGKYQSDSYFSYNGNSGSLYGQMHGAGATTTSGVFQSNGYYDETGAFIGSR